MEGRRLEFFILVVNALLCFGPGNVNVPRASSQQYVGLRIPLGVVERPPKGKLKELVFPIEGKKWL